MNPLTRRQFIHALALAGGALAFAARASASVARGLTLRELVAGSDHVIVGVPHESMCQRVMLGRQRCIVTDTRVTLSEVLQSRGTPAQEVMVRRLGGVIGDFGEWVSGQAELVEGEPSVLFLAAGAADPAWVTGMAQGHFPLRSDARGVVRLGASSRLPRLERREGSAVARLSGTDLALARELIRGSVR